jgi:YidC/Oxa1 family membrane protein insertase
MAYLYNQIFTRPILNLLVFFYQTIAGHDLGVAIILATILIRVLLFPFFHKGAKQQILMQRIQPKVKKIQELHKDDRNKQGEALMELYKEHGINPFSSFLLLLIQLPILITFNFVIRSFAAGQLAGLYHFISSPGAVSTLFLGSVDLSKPNIYILVLVAVAQFAQARLAIYRDPSNTAAPTQAEKIARQMMYVGPILTLAVFFNFPAAVALYWFTTSIFSAVQQYFVNKHLRAKYGA